MPSWIHFLPWHLLWARSAAIVKASLRCSKHRTSKQRQETHKNTFSRRNWCHAEKQNSKKKNICNSHHEAWKHILASHIQPQLIAKKRFGGQSDLCHPKDCSSSLKPSALFCLKIFLQRMLASITEIKLKLIERTQQNNKTQARYLWICTHAVLKANAVGFFMPPPEIFSQISRAEPGSDNCRR